MHLLNIASNISYEFTDNNEFFNFNFQRKLLPNSNFADNHEYIHHVKKANTLFKLELSRLSDTIIV